MATKTDLSDLTFFSGDDWPDIPFAVVQADGVTPENIATWTIEFSLYDDPTFLNRLFILSTATTGVTISNAAGGLGYFTVLLTNSALTSGGDGGTAKNYYCHVERIVGGLRRTIGLIRIPVRQ